MQTFKTLSVSEVKNFIKSDNLKIVDIRNPNDFSLGHMPKAISLQDDTIEEFLSTTNKDTPIVCVCYHGISSRQAAQFLVDKGFSDVYSMEGGYAQWSQEND